MTILERHVCTTLGERLLLIYIKTVDDNFRTLRNYAQISADFCKSMDINFWSIILGVLVAYVKLTSQLRKSVT